MVELPFSDVWEVQIPVKIMPYSDALKTIQGLIRNAETLAALGALCRAKAGEQVVDEVISNKLTAVQKAIDPHLLNDIGMEDARFLHLTVRANLRRALELVEASENAARWEFDDRQSYKLKGSHRGSSCV